MKSKSTLKTLIIGLDGATFDVMLPFIKAKKLPALAHLLETGAWGDLESTVPPVTAAAWTSFMTGQNPGKHGIIDFTRKDLSGREEIVTTQNFAGQTFFDFMGQRKMRTGAITVPVTYPPWDINGMMISGYPSPDNDKVYLASKGITVKVNEPLNFSAEYYNIASEEQIAEDCLYRDKLRSDLSFDLLGRYEFDCFVLVLGGIDRSQHNYWKYHDPDFPGVPEKKRGKFRDTIYRNYKLADEEISRFLDNFGEEANVFIMSDHGAARHPGNFFNVNLWLRKNGWLKLKAGKAVAREISRKIYHVLQAVYSLKKGKISSSLIKLKRKSISRRGGVSRVFDWKNTFAFHYPLPYPAGGITVNLKGREPSGIVQPGKEYDSLRDEIIQGLLNCRDMDGAKVVDRAMRREEIYNGPYVGTFPDIIYLLNTSYLGGTEIFGPVISKVHKMRLSVISGLHAMNGIFIAHGPQIKPCRVSGARIIDIAPTVLYSAGCPVPRDMDGAVLTGIFRDDVLKERPVDFCDREGRALSGEVILAEDEDEQMKNKLRSLGYI